MKKRDSTVLVIIVTFNGERWIEKCLNSVLNSNFIPDIFLFDNNSTDKTVEIISKFSNHIIIKKNKINLGFGKANNIGLRYAIKNNYRYVFLLNQDAYIEYNTISVLKEVSINNPEYGILSPLQFNGQGSQFDENFGQQLKTNKNKIKFHNGLYEVPFVNAAGWFMPINTLKKVGGFDPLFPHYGEDNDYARRVILNKLKIGITPAAKYFHDRDVENQKQLSIKKKHNLLLIGRINYLKSKKNPTKVHIFYLGFRSFLKALFRLNYSNIIINFNVTITLFKLIKKIKIHIVKEKKEIEYLYIK